MRALIIHFIAIGTGVAAYFATKGTCHYYNVGWLAYVGVLLVFMLFEAIAWTAINRANMERTDE